MELTERERQTAHALARTLARDVDAGEVGKVLAFWRRWPDQEKIFLLLERLPRSGVVRSDRTRGYYEAMNVAFRQPLRSVRPAAFGTVLAWSFRLMKYYQLHSGVPGRRPRGQDQRRQHR